MQISERDIYWLAGLLEGEGCFSMHKGNPRKDGTRKLYPLIRMNMNDKDIIERSCYLTGAKMYGPYKQGKGNSPKCEPYFRMEIYNSDAVDLMKIIRPLMGVRRGKAIDLVLFSSGSRP